MFLEQGDQCAKFKRGALGDTEIPTNARGEVLDIAVVAGRIFESRRPDERIDIEKRHQGLQKAPHVPCSLDVRLGGLAGSALAKSHQGFVFWTGGHHQVLVTEPQQSPELQQFRRTRKRLAREPLRHGSAGHLQSIGDIRLGQALVCRGLIQAGNVQLFFHGWVGKALFLSTFVN